jgi:hypothetical protein
MAGANIDEREALRTNPGDRKPSGNIIYNGSSYSGADIKLVFHSRHPEALWGITEQKQNEVAQLQDTLKQLDAVLKSDDDGFIDPVVINNGAKAVQETRSALNTAQQELDGLKEIQDKGIFTIATAQTLSIQSHTSKVPIRALGFNKVKGYTKGYTTHAGTIVFTVFNEHPLIKMLITPPSYWSHEQAGKAHPFLGAASQIPPFTITAVFANEYGTLSQLNIYGVEFVNDGFVMSIHDIFLEQTMTFVARDVDPMVAVGRLRSSVGTLDSSKWIDSASNLLNSPEYKDYSNRFNARSDPYL